MESSLIENKYSEEPRIAKCIDSRMMPSYEKYFKVQLVSPSQLLTQVSADSQTSTSLISFSGKPTENLFLSRRMVVSYELKVVVTGTSDTPSYPENVCLQAFPLQSASSNISLLLNNQNVSMPMNQVFQGLLPCIDSFSLSEAFGVPVQQDPFRHELGSTLGANNSPFSPTGSVSHYASQETRGSFVPISNTTDGNTRTMVFKVYEPILISPLSSDESKPYFIGVNQFKLSINIGNLNQMFSYTGSGSLVLSSSSVSLNSVPILLYTQLEPNSSVNLSAYSPSKPVYYPYSRVDSYSEPLTASISDTSTVTSNIQVRINQIPTRLIVWAGKIPGQYVSTDSNVFLRLTNVSLQYMNQNLLASADPYQLYNISRSNGLNNMSWNDWNTYKGSILVLSTKDLSIPANMASGMNVPSQLTLQCTWQNQLGTLQGNAVSAYTATNFQANLAVISSGFMRILNSDISIILGGISLDQVVNAKLVDTGSEVLNDSDELYGGGFFSSLRDIFKKVGRYVSPLVMSSLPPLIRQVAPRVGEYLVGKLKGGLRAGLRAGEMRPITYRPSGKYAKSVFSNV
jgi:hypothetical protein